MRQLFHEIDESLDEKKRAELTQYLAGMITTMVGQQYTGKGAVELLAELFSASKIDDEAITEPARTILQKHCIAMSAQTQYLCWVKARPGSTVNLQATYTQSDVARYSPEVGGVTRSSLRLRWRNWRSKQYAQYNILPLHYAFDTPAYVDCKSYYFTITSPPETRITLLDWMTGRRFRTMNEELSTPPRGRWRRRVPIPSKLPDGATEELDCANFAYHFYNRRNIELETSERRRRSATAGARLHAFVRSEPIENSQLVAIGALSLTLAVLAERGSLTVGSGGGYGVGGVGQWLLLAPAALTLFVAQHRRHHYARLTRRYRLSIWIYIVLAMLFAGSVAFDAATLPVVSNDFSDALPTVVSGVFAIASAVLIIAAGWSGRHFEISVRRRAERIIRRVYLYGTPSAWDVVKEHKRSPLSWFRRNETPLPDSAIQPHKREDHPSYKSYVATARHSIDRALALTAAGVLIVAGLMIFAFPWGQREMCAATRGRVESEDAEQGKPLRGGGKCVDGEWRASRAASATKSAAHPKSRPGLHSQPATAPSRGP
jgi:hypothetical protein